MFSFLLFFFFFFCGNYWQSSYDSGLFKANNFGSTNCSHENPGLKIKINYLDRYDCSFVASNQQNLCVQSYLCFQVCDGDVHILQDPRTELAQRL